MASQEALKLDLNSWPAADLSLLMFWFVLSSEQAEAVGASPLTCDLDKWAHVHNHVGFDQRMSY